MAQQATIFGTVRDSKRPRPVAGSDVESRVHSDPKTLPASQLPLTGLASPGANASASDDSDDEDDLFGRIDMEALGIRGKGSHYCPLGHRCSKGGVDKDGTLVLFDRNSSFAYACNLIPPPPPQCPDLSWRSCLSTFLTNPRIGNIATNIESLGVAIPLGAQTRQRNADLPAETV